MKKYRLLSLILITAMLLTSCSSLKDKITDRIDEIAGESAEETAYRSTWENPNWGREMNPLFLNGDAEYLDADDLDPLKLALVDTFMTDLYVTESSEAVVLYWIEGVRADSEYMCIYISSYCECYDAEEPYSYSVAAVLKTALSPTTDYCAVSSNRWVSYETATMENFPAAIRETCSPVPTEDRTVHEVLVK